MRKAGRRAAGGRTAGRARRRAIYASTRQIIHGEEVVGAAARSDGRGSREAGGERV